MVIREDSGHFLLGSTVVVGLFIIQSFIFAKSYVFLLSQLLLNEQIKSICKMKQLENN